MVLLYAIRLVITQQSLASNGTNSAAVFSRKTVHGKIRIKRVREAKKRYATLIGRDEKHDVRHNYKTNLKIQNTGSR